MLSSIRNRLILMGVMVAASIWSLLPREVTVRQLGEDGRMTDIRERRVPLQLGLDLKGGIHLALEVDHSQGAVANPEEATDRALTVIRQRIDEFGTLEAVVQKSGTERIVVELPGEQDPTRAKNIVMRSAFLEFRITDMQGLFAQALPRIDRALSRAGVSAAPGASTASPLDQLLQRDSAGADSALGDTASAGDTTDLTTGGALSSLLFQGGLPGEFLVPEEAWQRVDSLLELPEVQREIPRGIETFWGAEPRSQGNRAYRPFYAVQNRAIITGDQLSDAQANIDPQRGGSIVTFELTRAGGRIFSRETARHIRDHMAIILDNRVQSQPPVIQSEIGRNGQIELGNASLREAQDLALVLRAGALPAPLHIVEERTIGPSLGEDSIQKGITAAVVGAALILIMVVGYYRLAGVLAVVGLALYSLFTLGMLAAFGAAITLPGLAGFILSVGMAVDANVLVFERMREEIKAKRTPRAAVDMGFQNALPAIVDSNLTTIITALFLLQFGTGPVQGFAITLIIGILASFVSAVFVTKTFFLIWLERRTSTRELIA
jgi:preprotein translocase subunit SecD